MDALAGTAEAVEGADGDQAAAVDDAHAVADLFDLAEQMTGQEHGAARAGQVAEQQAQVMDACRKTGLNKFSLQSRQGAQ